MALKMPLLRHYLGYLGIIPATSKVLQNYIEKEGASIGISSGGVAEIFETNAKDGEVIFMKDRKGFVKLALRTGTTIVPCYIFGNTKIMDVFYDPYGVLQNLSRYLKFGLCLLYGRFGLPIMKRKSILGVTGYPIYVPKLPEEKITKELIDHYHNLFMEELDSTFEEFKHVYGWSEKKLIMK